MYYGDYLRSLNCSCKSCASEGRLEAGLDCLWASPYRYALSKGADEDTAEEFAEDMRERQYSLGVTVPTAEGWKSFQAKAGVR